MQARFDDAQIGRLLAHSDWLAALAQGLVRDPSAADDLVQDTWQAALREPLSEVRNLRAWLATAIANLARARARGEAARRARELRCAADERIDGPDALVERAQVQRKLLGLVLALEEPYRSTVLARYVEGRSAVEIARRSGLNESTVRTRLARALAQLREKLEREAGRDRMLGLAPLCLGGRAAATGAMGTSASLAGIGAWTLSTTTKLGLAAAALLIAWAAWRGFDEPQPLRAVDPTTTPDIASLEPAEQQTEATTRPERQALESVAIAAPAASQPTPPVAEAEGKYKLDIVFLRDEAPVADVSVWLIPANRGSIQVLDLLDLNFPWPADALRARSNHAGVAAFTKLETTRYYVGFDSAPEATRPSRRAHGIFHTGQRYEFRLGSGAIHGCVFDSSGRPRVGVGLQASFSAPEPRGKSYVSAQALTNERGEYRIEGLAALDYFMELDPDGRFDGFGDVRRLRIRLSAGEERELDFGSRLPSTLWRGRALTAFDEPFPGRSRLELERENQLERLSTQTDTDGSFQVAFTPGRWSLRLFATGSPEGGFELGVVDLPDADLLRDIVVPGARVQGRVSAAAGGPALSEDLLISMRQKGHDYAAAFRTVDAEANGDYTIDGLEPGLWIFSAWPGELLNPPEVLIPEGARALRQDLSWRVP